MFSNLTEFLLVFPFKMLIHSNQLRKFKETLKKVVKSPKMKEMREADHRQLKISRNPLVSDLFYEVTISWQVSLQLLCSFQVFNNFNFQSASYHPLSDTFQGVSGKVFTYQTAQFISKDCFKNGFHFHILGRLFECPII